MYQLGIDLGSSSVKVALVESSTGVVRGLVKEPSDEMKIYSPEKDWAEQDPELWWKLTCTAIQKLFRSIGYQSEKISGIGIAYQMHGLVVLDQEGVVIRNSIIWCDSRAVEIGKKAEEELGTELCQNELLNSPGNFTASKLKWLKQFEPENYQKVYKFMLPGDYIAFKLSGEISSTINGLSEGVFWDYSRNKPSDALFNYFGISKSMLPGLVNNFSVQCRVNSKSSAETGIPAGTPIMYRSGDQPNNALSLNILRDGEVAMTGGTSGVIFAVSNKIGTRELSKYNNFAHINHRKDSPSVGKLLCINGCGIQYNWLNKQFKETSYEIMNRKAMTIPIGSEGLKLFPFGNGAERMFNNKNIGTHISNLNLNVHTKAHIYRAALEGIAFSFVYGMELLEQDQVTMNLIRAGNDNLFQSEVFVNTLTSLTGVNIEIYNTTGAVGAARACGLTSGDYKKFAQNTLKNDYIKSYIPQLNSPPYFEAYYNWKSELEQILNNK